jgi:NAD(P)-dependent dehydrogenase (short-subunit alcohol dehydrogenase family)
MNQTVVITGCSTGIGYDPAQKRARGGDRVCPPIRAPRGSSAEPAGALRNPGEAESHDLPVFDLEVIAAGTIDGRDRRGGGRLRWRRRSFSHWLRAGTLGVAAACSPGTPERSSQDVTTTSSDHLFVWTAAADSSQPDFLAVLDVRAGSERYGGVVATLAVPGVRNGPHQKTPR